MTALADLAPVSGTDIAHGCAYNGDDSVVFRADTNRGDVIWATQYGTATTHGETCRGIVNHEDSRTGAGLIVALIESDAGENFGGDGNAGDRPDAFVLIMDLSGDVLEAVQLSIKRTGMTIADGTFLRWGESFYWAGKAEGFTTELQDKEFDGGYTNGLVFKYEFDHPASYDCVFEYPVKAGKLRSSLSAGYPSSDIVK